MGRKIVPVFHNAVGEEPLSCVSLRAFNKYFKPMSSSTYIGREGEEIVGCYGSMAMEDLINID